LSISHFREKYTNFWFRDGADTFLTLFIKYLQKTLKPRKIKHIGKNTERCHMLLGLITQW
jgi:hypothetical protein